MVSFKEKIGAIEGCFQRRKNMLSLRGVNTNHQNVLKSQTASEWQIFLIFLTSVKKKNAVCCINGDCGRSCSYFITHCGMTDSRNHEKLTSAARETLLTMTAWWTGALLSAILYVYHHSFSLADTCVCLSGHIPAVWGVILMLHAGIRRWKNNVVSTLPTTLQNNLH